MRATVSPRDELDGDLAVELGIVGGDDHAHTALAELAADLEVPDGASRVELAGTYAARHAVGLRRGGTRIRR